MKRLITFILLVAGSGICLHAQNSNSGTLKISFNDGEYVAVNVDGNYFEDKGKTVEVKDLQPGEHKLQIYKANGPNAPANMRPPIVKEMNVTTLAASTTIITLSSDGSNMRTTQTSNSANGSRRTTTRYKHSTAQYSPNIANHNATATSFEMIVIPDAELSQIKDAARQAQTDVAKTQVIKERVGTRVFMSKDVNDFLRLIKNETERVSLAKWAFMHLSDQENFKVVKSQFKRSASKKEINDIIAKRKKFAK